MAPSYSRQSLKRHGVRNGPLKIDVLFVNGPSRRIWRRVVPYRYPTPNAPCGTAPWHGTAAARRYTVRWAHGDAYIQYDTCSMILTSAFLLVQALCFVAALLHYRAVASALPQPRCSGLHIRNVSELFLLRCRKAK